MDDITITLTGSAARRALLHAARYAAAGCSVAITVRDDGHIDVEPTDLPTAWFEAGTYHDDPVEAGQFVDWRDDVVREFVYTLRQQRPQPSFEDIAARYGFQHPLHAYRASDAWARRIDDPGARGSTPLRLNDHRSWTRETA